MTPFVIQLTRGFKPSEIDSKDYKTYKELNAIGALEEVGGLVRLKSIYRAGEVYINKDGVGFLSSLFSAHKDLQIEKKDLNGAKNGDFVVAKRIIARRGRASAKVVKIIKHAVITQIFISKKIDDKIEFIDIKTELPSAIKSDKIDLKIYKEGTLFKVDALTNEVVEVLGHIDDLKVDEKISLALFNRYDKFPKEVLESAKDIPSFVSSSDIKDRIDLRKLPFCTIDPVTAKDFDDAIFWDEKENTLYVAIADVSYYVKYLSPIDKEAIKRGFTTYLPHIAHPMLPRILSENICSLKPHVDRLSFIAKIKLNENLEPISEEFFEGVIHSKRRFNYDEIDKFLKGDLEAKNSEEKEIFKYLKPLYEVTKKLKAKRLKKGFDFRSEEIKLTLDSNFKLKDTIIETGTPSHSLIEECMLLANQAAAKRFTGEGDAIFRVHEAPSENKINELLVDLATIGIFIEQNDNEDIVTTIRKIQKEAKKLNLEAEVDELIIKSLKQASYSAFNIGHFGLGFEFYSHFTSPIRRYSDLILHRLIKAQLKNDKEQIEFLLRNIEPLSAKMSELERESTKCEWDFRDRKFARWAKDNIGNKFRAEIIEVNSDELNISAKAKLLEGARGAMVNLKAYKSRLFDKIEVEIIDANIYNPTILAKEV